jgi:hypothetical protein
LKFKDEPPFKFGARTPKGKGILDRTILNGKQGELNELLPEHARELMDVECTHVDYAALILTPKFVEHWLLLPAEHPEYWLFLDKRQIRFTLMIERKPDATAIRSFLKIMDMILTKTY